MSKEELRDLLFQKYFDDGVSVRDLNDKLSFIPETYDKLRVLCEKNLMYFDSFSMIEKFKLVDKYLVLKMKMWGYVVIDIENMSNISESEFSNLYHSGFFQKYFNEKDTVNFLFYVLEEYMGDISELYNFYFENKEVFELDGSLRYRYEIDGAWTWLFVDYINRAVQLGFQTHDQYLYEQLFFNYDLIPCGMQDAHNKMGINKMYEIFSRIGDIRVPVECIPENLYECYLKDKKSLTLC